MKLLYGLALLLALPLRSLAAQELPQVVPGTRIRVNRFRQDGWDTGTLDSFDSTSMVLDRGNGKVVTLRRRSGSRVEVSAGPGVCGSGRRILCVFGGLLGGAALGFRGGMYLTRNDNSTDSGIGAAVVLFVAMPVGALGGTILGSTLGGERWRRADWPTHLSLAPDLSGDRPTWHALRVGVHFAFSTAGGDRPGRQALP